MTDRERWIVYPLLFFAIMIGAADLMQRGGMLDDWMGPPRFRELRCRQLVIEDRAEDPLAVLNQNEFGEVQLTLINEEGSAALLKASEGGGQLILIRESDQQSLFIGHDSTTKFSGIEGVEISQGNLKPSDSQIEQVEVLDWP